MELHHPAKTASRSYLIRDPNAARLEFALMRKPDATRPETPNRSTMRRLFSAISRHRPRALTLLVLLTVIVLIVLANLSFDQFMDYRAGFGAKSCGWPLIWHRYVFVLWGGRTVGWYYSAPRLAGDIVIWLALMSASCGACEWLLRRYGSRPRWSLRTMLVAISIIGVLCAWFAAARNRADLGVTRKSRV